MLGVSKFFDYKFFPFFAFSSSRSLAKPEAGEKCQRENFMARSSQFKSSSLIYGVVRSLGIPSLSLSLSYILTRSDTIELSDKDWRWIALCQRWVEGSLYVRQSIKLRIDFGSGKSKLSSLFANFRWKFRRFKILERKQHEYCKKTTEVFLRKKINFHSIIFIGNFHDEHANLVRIT